MNSTGISQFNQARVEWAIRLRYSPMPKLDMELLAGELNAFRIGELRTVGKTWEVMMERDGELAINSEKRKADSACLEWQISSDGSPDGDKHAAALQYFYDNLTATKALDQDATGSVDELVFQTLSAVDFYYSAHEILLRVDNPEAKEITAEFRHTPLWFFEARRGYLGYLKHIFDMYGQPCIAGEWLTAVNTGWMRQLTMPYAAKWNSVSDWLIFCRRYGSGFLEAISNATKDSQEWNDAASALVSLANEGTVLHNREVEFKFVEQSSRNQLPYQPVVELVDRLYAKCYRGVDLATGSRSGEGGAGGGAGGRNPVGASVQKEESGILLVRDAKWITGVFNDRIDRPIIRYLFNEEPRAWFALLPPLDDTSSEDLQSLQTLVPMGLRVGLKEVYKRFRWTVPDEGEPCLQPAQPGSAAASIASKRSEDGPAAGQGDRNTPAGRQRSQENPVLSPQPRPEDDGETHPAQTTDTTPIAAGADPARNPGLVSDSRPFNAAAVDNPLSSILDPQAASRQMPDTQVDAGAFWSRVGLAPLGADGQTLPMPSLGYAVPNESLKKSKMFQPSSVANLADRHASLVARGLGHSRAAQALHREINRRCQAEASLANAGFNPDESRDSHGRWTTDAGGSATNHPAQTTSMLAPETARPIGGKLPQNAYHEAVAELGTDANGLGTGSPPPTNAFTPKAFTALAANPPASAPAQAASPKFTLEVAPQEHYSTWGDYAAAHPEIPRSFAHPEEDQPSPAAEVGQFFGKLGRMLSGGLADLGETITGYPTHENFSAALAGEPMPMVQESRLLPTPLRIVERGAQGLVESAPKIGAVAALQAGGVPAPISAGLIFGTTEQGFDLKQGILAAALPVLGKYSGAITEAIASKAGVSSAAALQAFNKIGGAGGAAALISADQWRQIMNLPPEQRKDAFIDAAANIGTGILLGTLGEGSKKQNIGAEAAKYLEKSGNTGQWSDANDGEAKAQIEDLKKWAQATGHMTNFDPPEGAKQLGGNEREGFVDPVTNRVFKRTDPPGTFGLLNFGQNLEKIATPYSYLRRIALMNKVFNSDIRVEGITPGDNPSIVTSEPLREALDEKSPHPSAQEVEMYMRAHGFEPLRNVDNGWGRKSDGIQAYDARPENFIKTKDGIAPIDLVLQGGPSTFPEQ